LQLTSVAINSFFPGHDINIVSKSEDKISLSIGYFRWEPFPGVLRRRIQDFGWGLVRGLVMTVPQWGPEASKSVVEGLDPWELNTPSS